MFIKHFRHISKSDALIAGGKGASLGEMTRAGIPVPPGFVVLASAFERFLAEVDLGVEIDSILHTVKHTEMHTVEHASEKIQALILSAKMPKDIREEIRKEFKKLNTKFVAIRSSATVEDSASAAWAGQLDSFLNTVERNLLENVQKCWASLFTPRAIFYRLEKGLHKHHISVAVVVQKMVESEVSGVAFSVHPVTEDPNQLIIEAGFGLGEAVVSGQVTPDSYVVEKQPRRILDKNISEQKKQLVRSSYSPLSKGALPSSAGGMSGNKWVDIPQVTGEKQKLSDKQILELSNWILKVENHYGFPCDIEWAFAKGQFYILQSRPITTLKGSVPPSVTLTQEFQSALLSCAEMLKEFDIKPHEWVLVGPHADILNEYPIRYDRPTHFHVLLEREKIPWKISKEQENLIEVIPPLNSRFQRRYERYMTETGHDFDLIVAPKPLTHYTNHIHVQPLPRGTFFQRMQPFGNVDVSEYIFSQFSPDKLERADVALYTEVMIAEAQRRNDSALLARTRKFIGSLVKRKGKTEIALSLLDEFARTHVLKGVGIFKGVVTGEVRVIDNVETVVKKKVTDIAVVPRISPKIIPAISGAKAWVVDEGGVLSHAAVLARELRIPCVVGTKVALKALKDGDTVEVNSKLSRVRKIG